jgi:hypothetical protein
MKKIFVVFGVMIFCACNSSKNKKPAQNEDTALRQRLSECIKATSDMDIEKVMDYTYPRLFTIAPRTQLVKAMKDVFDNKEMKVENSAYVDTLYPVFTIGKGSYAKIKYVTVMIMTLLNSEKIATSKYPEVQAEINTIINRTLVTESRKQFTQKYGEENVNVDEFKSNIRVRILNEMLAIKDEYSKEWSFLSMAKDDPMDEKLFPKEVLEELATYK